MQSANLLHCSTETALLRVVSDILSALDSGNLSLLLLLDFSAAFDSVNHDTLVTRLSQSHSLTRSVLVWFQSHQCGRTQFVRVFASQSVTLQVPFAVPQGSVLGPILFLVYVADLLQLVRHHLLSSHAR